MYLNWKCVSWLLMMLECSILSRQYDPWTDGPGLCKKAVWEQTRVDEPGFLYGICSRFLPCIPAQVSVNDALYLGLSNKISSLPWDSFGNRVYQDQKQTRADEQPSKTFSHSVRFFTFISRFLFLLFCLFVLFYYRRFILVPSYPVYWFGSYFLC